MKSEITLGQDPELHVFDKDNGRIVSARPVLNGHDKHNPVDLGDGILVYPDNVLIECAHPPCTTIDEIVNKTRIVFARMLEYLGPRYALVPKAAHMYDEDQLKDRKCWEAGCAPNADAYLMKENRAANFTDGLRTGSFHLHIGHPAVINIGEKIKMVKLLDIFVGCASIIFDKDETSPLRRALYGKAGEFRQTPYGVEYRVLGNWALSQPATTRFVWEMVMHAIERYDAGEAKDIIEAVGSARVQTAINLNSKAKAIECLEIASTPYSLLDKIKQDWGTNEFKKAWGI